MGTITVTNLGKAYKQYPSRWSRLAEWMDPRGKPHHTLHWVLRDIGFVVRPGEAVGLIGLNGAGKSTLLKMIVGTTQPTIGNVQMTGRVAALLELGMGFHPDFTGRQNAIMAGQLLGYSVEEMAVLMPEIEAFAEIGEYIDQPVRVYSSGMQVRLAFAVATAHRPDVLIVDEALSVGDTYFQHKSFDRIREFRKQGTTLLLVSHDKAAIQSICDRAILLNAGRLAMEGEPEAVMDYYNALLAQRGGQEIKRETLDNGKTQTVSGTGEASVSSIELFDDSGQPLALVAVGQPVVLRVGVRCGAPIERLVIGFMIKDRLGQTIFGTTSQFLGCDMHDLPGESSVAAEFRFRMNLGEGSYSIATALADSNTHTTRNFEWKDLALTFNVVNLHVNEFVGTSYLDVAVMSERV